MFYFKEIRKIKGTLGLSTFIAGLACVPSMIMVMFGLSTVSAAASLSYNLYSGYVWGFRAVALLTLMAGLFYYFYKKENISTLDDAKRERNRIINVVFLSTIILVIAYVIWFYVILNYFGAQLGLW